MNKPFSAIVAALRLAALVLPVGSGCVAHERGAVYVEPGHEHDHDHDHDHDHGHDHDHDHDHDDHH